MIIKKILQVSQYDQPEYVKNKILKYSEDWEYSHFSDVDILKYFDENPMDGFENIKEKFIEIKNGAHKADLFRYYYMYKHGGMFIDSDLRIETEIDNIVKDYEFISSVAEKQKRMFNGLLYVSENNAIIYECLKHLYEIDINYLDDNYHIVCEFLYNLINENSNNMSVLLYWMGGEEDPDRIFNARNELVATHFWKDGYIPND